VALPLVPGSRNELWMTPYPDAYAEGVQPTKNCVHQAREHVRRKQKQQLWKSSRNLCIKPSALSVFSPECCACSVHICKGAIATPNHLALSRLQSCLLGSAHLASGLQDLKGPSAEGDCSLRLHRIFKDLWISRKFMSRNKFDREP